MIMKSKSSNNIDEDIQDDFEDVGEENDDIESSGDGEFELNKPEGEPLSAEKWKRFLIKSEFAEDVEKKILNMKPYKRCEKTAQIVPTESLNNFAEGVCLFLESSKKIPPKILNSLCKEVFSRCDIMVQILPQMKTLIERCKSLNCWWNVYNMARFLPDPATEIAPRLFETQHHTLRSARKKRVFINAYQTVWITMLQQEIPLRVLVKVIPYVSENVLDKLNEPHRTADFFFRIFSRGDMPAILALGAIFKLMVNHNFEYPSFYQQVYALTKPSVVYLEHKQKFFELLDTFLSSTHLPSYVVASFVKRLCRIVLLAPVDSAEPLMGLMRNLITRHPPIQGLLHRPVPATLDADPYDENEPDLSKCGALDSSLWELRTLQQHWHQNVARRAYFVDKIQQQILLDSVTTKSFMKIASGYMARGPIKWMESFVRFRCVDEMFSNLMGRKFGSESNAQEEMYERCQDGSDEEDQPQAKKAKMAKKKGGNPFQRKREVERENVIPINFSQPDGNLFPQNTFSLDYKSFWDV